MTSLAKYALALGLLFSAKTALALSGDLIDAKDVIPQTCRVVFRSGEICSAGIIGKKAVSLAGHCGMLMVKKHGSKEPIGRVLCLGEKEAHVFYDVLEMTAEDVTSRTGEKFKDGVLPKATDNSDLETARYDVAAIVVEGEFAAPPLAIAKPNQSEAIALALATPGACHMYGVGWNAFGTTAFAVPHGVDAPLYRQVGGPQNPLNLEGSSGITPMDSGGPLTCLIGEQNVLVGIASKGNGVVATTVAEHLKTNLAKSTFAYAGDPAVSAWLSAVAQKSDRKMSNAQTGSQDSLRRN